MRIIERLPSGLTRADMISIYLNRTDIPVVSRPELGIVGPNSLGTAVIPAYNEAHQICETLASVPEGMDAIVIDNNSTDGTANVVREFAKYSAVPIALVDCKPQGYGPTRRTGFNQVLANYLALHPKADRTYHMVMMDADSQFCPEWMGHHRRLAEEAYAAIGVTYRFPREIDRMIEECCGLPDYLFSIAQLSSKLTCAGIAKIQTAAQGGAIEVGAFAAIDPEMFRRHETRGSDRFLGTAVKIMGRSVGFNPAVNIHKERRVTLELVRGIAANGSYVTHPGEIRNQQQAMTAEEICDALQRTPREQYVTHHYERLLSFVKRNIVDPINLGETSGAPLAAYCEERCRRIDTTAENAVYQLAALFISEDEMLSTIYEQ